MKSINKIGCVYALIDPVTKMTRYIGQTINARKRFNKHLYESRGKSTHKECWISGLLLIGLRPEMEIIEEVDIKDLDFMEEFYIGLYKTWGFDLTNISLEPCGRRVSEQTKIKQSGIKLKSWRDPIYRESQSASIRQGITNDWDRIREIFSKNAKKHLHTIEAQKNRTYAIKAALNTDEYKEYKRKETKDKWSALSTEEREIRINKFRSNEVLRKNNARKSVQTDEYKIAQSLIIKERWKRRFRVVNKNGETVGEWDNICTAAIELGVHASGISAVLRGVTKTTKGLKAYFL